MSPPRRTCASPPQTSTAVTSPPPSGSSPITSAHGRGPLRLQRGAGRRGQRGRSGPAGPRRSSKAVGDPRTSSSDSAPHPVSTSTGRHERLQRRPRTHLLLAQRPPARCSTGQPSGYPARPGAETTVPRRATPAPGPVTVAAWRGWRWWAPGWAGSPRPRGSPPRATRSPCSSRPRQVGGKLGRLAARRPRLRHRPEPGHAAAGLPRPVRRHRRAARGVAGPGAARPRRGLPLRRRHAAGLPRRPEAVPGALDAALGAGAGAQWSALMARAERMWRISEGPFLRTPLPAPRPWPGWPAARPTSPPSRPGGRCAGSAPAVPARPAPADPARPLRHLLRLRPAPGTGGAGDGALRGAGVRLLVRARRAAPARAGGGRAGGRARRRAAHRLRGAPGRGRRRPGARAWSWPTARWSPPTSSSPAPTPRRSTPTCCRRTGGRRRRPPGAGPRDAVAVGVRAAARRCAAARPGLAHHTVLFPADYDAEFDAVFGTGRDAGAPRPVADPTVYVSAPDDPALRPDEDSESWFVLVNAPRHDPGGASTGTRRGWPGGTPTGCWTVMAERGLDVRDRVRLRVVRTPADLERDTGSVGGSIYGTSSNGARAAFLRPANASPVPGLFLVGGSAHPGGGLPLVDAVRGDRRRAGRPRLTAPRRPPVRGSSRCAPNPPDSGSERDRSPASSTTSGRRSCARPRASPPSSWRRRCRRRR